MPQTIHCPPELAAHLTQLFPDRAPDLSELSDPVKVAWNAGAAYVAKYAKQLSDDPTHALDY